MADHIIGLLLLILCFGRSSWCFPPQLNVTGEFTVDTRTQSSFSIRCAGTEHLFWNWTANFSHNDTDVVQITHDKHVNTERPFVSTLTIFDPFRQDTGFFRCHYAGVEDYVTDYERAASAYAYIFDGEAGLVYYNIHGSLHVATDQKLIIPCRTTLPNITVNLDKDGYEISSTLTLQWDPKIGFVVRNLAIHDSGWYTCSIKGSEDQTATYVVQVNPAASLTKPGIDWEDNQHFVVGHSFKISCSLLISEDVTFQWEVPNPTSNYTVSPSSIMRKESEYRMSTLIMHSATLEDSGIYTCRVSSPGFTSNEETRHIFVKETLEPYVNITSINAVPILEGDTLKWKAGVRAFPINPVIIYRNWQGREVIETERITTEHHMDNAESWLKIQNITADDFGNYTIEVILTDGSVRKSHTVTIEVISKPSPRLMGVSRYVKEGTLLTPHCKTKGFPKVNTTWWFKACPDGELSCTNDYNDLSLVNEPKEEILPPGNIVNSSIEFHPKESGLLRCEVRNDNGTGGKAVPVSISDIEGNFVFRHTGDGTNANVLKEYGSIDVVVNDKHFELMCGASKYYYNRTLLTIPDYITDLKISTKETNFSRIQQVFATKVTYNLAGKYHCTAYPHEDPTRGVVKELSIQVIDEERVVFVNANMNPDGNEIVMDENEPYDLNCTVTGTPTPKILWFKDDEPLTPDSPLFDDDTIVTIDKSFQHIHFEYVFTENLGTYSCVAENRLNKIAGYLTIAAPSPGISTGGKVGLAVAIIGITVLMFVVVYLVKRVKTERKFRKSFRKNELYLFEKGNIGQLNPDCTADEQAELLPYDPNYEVDRSNIKLGRQLGAGAFGRVVKTVVSGLEDDKPHTTVALKMCKSNADQSQVRALSLELKIMIHLGKHLNIVNLMGANTVHIGRGELWILVEYCRFGNLLSFMHRHRNKFINQIDPMTGKIDFKKVSRDPMSPFSPTSHNSGSQGYKTSPITDMDGYLAPSSSQFTLGSPPNRRATPSPPQSPTSVTGSTNASSKSDESCSQYANNPMYSMALQRSVSVDPEGDPTTRNNLSGSMDVEAAIRKERINSTTSMDSGRMHRMDSIANSDTSRKQRLHSNSLSETGSVGYSREDAQIINTDMTILQSNTSHLSPLSPTDSSHPSDMGVDSKGNPFCYDAGIVPAITAPFTTSDLVCWGWQVAQGMEYLSHRKVLHGDLAARNLLLANDNVIKISDFGLSREMYKKDVYMKKGDDLMPIKWMSLEAIRDRIFTVQSDVWAYGVTMWELFTLGSTPYPGIEVNKDFLPLIENGYRMDRPKYANNEIYDVLLSCWESDPRQRPSFALAADRLEVLMLPDVTDQYMSMNDENLRMNEERFRNDTDYLNMLASPNFDNLNKEDESRPHYVNVGDIPDGVQDSNYISMKSAEVVGYSRIGLNPNAGSMPQNSPAKSHYLPMGTAQGTASPMIDVFSPRPNEIPKFTFGGGTTAERPSRLTDLPEEDENAAQIRIKEAEDLATEKSSLISGESHNSSADDIIKDVLISSSDKLQSESIEDANSENEPVLYVNLPTHGVDYVNL